MLVGISLLTLVPGVVGGSETYVRGLLAALGRERELDYRVFVPTIAPDAAHGLSARVVPSYRAQRTMRGRAAAMALAAARPAPVRNELELDRLDVLHFPLSVMLPPVRRPPTVTTVLDVQHEYLPGFFSRAELAYRRVAYRWTARRSTRLVAISEHAKRTLVERLGVETERVDVIHLGVDHALFRPGAEPRRPFLLYPANRWPHKNHERLLEAFALLRAERAELDLVLTGTGHDGRPAPAGVRTPGRVSLEELAALYRSASALVFPSLYEGFGQPPLEAMASGCPVAASDLEPLREVCGDAAAYFDPTSPDAIAAAVSRVLDEPEPFSAAGVRRAAAFTWERCAREHEAVYRETAMMAA